MTFDRLIPEILFGFMGLVGIINPFGMAFVFLERTQSLTEPERAMLSKKLGRNVFFTLLVIFFVGAPVLNFFGISMEALRIGGGFAVAVAGWSMLNAPDVSTDASVAHGSDFQNLMARAFFPLTVPLTIGPGSIAAGIALHANRSHGAKDYLLSGVISVAVAALVAFAIWQIYSRATTLARYLGGEGTKVAMRVSAFLLLCVGVQIMLTGIAEFARSIGAQAG
ncbi:MarC family protein [Burkholderia pyrrocinia]|uniref:MarC family protein n=1 Tax=Burkholderia TaxID=32008 RepID=UPI000508133B|nr:MULTISPECIES: MarC family protein [Burkholderia]EKS9889362.1 NAAT family transporter [Burkholderia pyrrocinia]EKS9897764.1 NAAT family transporter [Burkholderia pyrrocinia]EKS9910815.1 NAAT family transporter [Burkholderia pyrrocinia]KFL52271.1 antibiotic resistance protein [Burkholderia pyrrocinia]UOB57987.1 NAAT family transporter [Burkholderia pyrrocinia]